MLIILELIYQVHGISITKLFVIIDVFYPLPGWSGSPWKMNEAEVRDRVAFCIITNSPRLPKSSAGLFKGENPGSPRNEDCNDNWKTRGPPPGHEAVVWRSAFRGLSGQSGWLSWLVPTGHRRALALGYCAGRPPRPQVWSVSARGCPQDPAHRWAIVGPQAPEDACCCTREAGGESGDGFTALLPLPGHRILPTGVQESPLQKRRLHTDPLSIFREADGAGNNASGEMGFQGKGLDSQTSEGRKRYLPVYSLVLGTEQTFNACLLKATPGNPKAHAAADANNSWMPPAAGGACVGHHRSRPSALSVSGEGRRWGHVEHWEPVGQACLPCKICSLPQSIFSSGSSETVLNPI